MKNQTELVSHNTVSAVNTTAPSAGSASLGMPEARTTKILAVSEPADQGLAGRVVDAPVGSE